MLYRRWPAALGECTHCSSGVCENGTLYSNKPGLISVARSTKRRITQWKVRSRILRANCLQLNDKRGDETWMQFRCRQCLRFRLVGICVFSCMETNMVASQPIQYICPCMVHSTNFWALHCLTFSKRCSRIDGCHPSLERDDWSHLIHCPRLIVSSGWIRSIFWFSNSGVAQFNLFGTCTTWVQFSMVWRGSVKCSYALVKSVFYHICWLYMAILPCLRLSYDFNESDKLSRILF